VISSNHENYDLVVIGGWNTGLAVSIHLFALAIRSGLTAADLREAVYAYRTFASAIHPAVP